MPKGKKKSNSLRPKSSDNGTQTQEIQLQFQGNFNTQPEQVQTIKRMKMLVRNFVTCDIQKKIDHTDELIKVTSKMISTKKDLNTIYSQKLRHIDNIMRKISETTFKKTKELEKIRQIYEVNSHNIEESDNAVMDLFGLAYTKELELAELRTRGFGYTEKVKQLKGEFKDLQNNKKRINDHDDSLRKALAEDKERYEHIFQQNNKIEENLAKLNAEEQDILDRQTEITNEINNIKENILVESTTTAQNRSEIAKLKPINEDLRNIVTSNNNTIEQIKQQIEVAKMNLVDSRVENRFRICDLQRYNNDIKKEMENALHSFNAKRNEMIENIKLETERVQKDQQLKVEKKQQAIDKPVNTMKRKLTPARLRPQRRTDDMLMDLANTSTSPLSSSNCLEVSFLISKRAKITNNNNAIMPATLDSDSDSDNFEF